jgi:hypothetical protein
MQENAMAHKVNNCKNVSAKVFDEYVVSQRL